MGRGLALDPVGRGTVYLSIASARLAAIRGNAAEAARRRAEIDQPALDPDDAAYVAAVGAESRLLVDDAAGALAEAGGGPRLARGARRRDLGDAARRARAAGGGRDGRGGTDARRPARCDGRDGAARRAAGVAVLAGDDLERARARGARPRGARPVAWRGRCRRVARGRRGVRRRPRAPRRRLRPVPVRRGRAPGARPAGRRRGRAPGGRVHGGRRPARGRSPRPSPRSRAGRGSRWMRLRRSTDGARGGRRRRPVRPIHGPRRRRSGCRRARSRCWSS